MDCRDGDKSGPDLHPVPGVKPSRFDYGMLLPRFFADIRDRVLQAHLDRRLDRVPPTQWQAPTSPVSYNLPC